MFDHRKQEFLIDVDSACPFPNGKSLWIYIGNGHCQLAEEHVHTDNIARVQSLVGVDFSLSIW